MPASSGNKPNPRERLLRIIEMLLERELTTEELEQNLYGTRKEHKRTIQQDLNYLTTHFGEDKLIKIGRNDTYYYRLINLPRAMHDLYLRSPDEIKNIYEFLGLFDAKMLDVFEQSEPKIVKAIRKEIQQIYTIITPPSEHYENNEIWEKARKAVKDKRKAAIGYMKDELIAYNHAKPLKIVYMHNNWYLATLLHEHQDRPYTLTFLRMKQISSIEVSSEEYYLTPDIRKALDHIEQSQTPFEQYGAPKFKVIVKADKGIARYFKHKRYLKSQQIIAEESDGSLLISYEITQTQELFPIIQKWLPQMHIIEPPKVKKQFAKMLARYLKKQEHH